MLTARFRLTARFSGRCALVCLMALLPAEALAGDTSGAVLVSRLKMAGGSNVERAAKLRNFFSEAGCTLTEQPVMKGTAPPNLICTLPGASQDVILVGAHFDAKGPGFADNWTGSVLLPALYQELKALSPRHTFLFVGFSEEEKGLIGSREYVSQMNAAQRRAMKAMVNIDTLGLGITNVWVSRADKQLTFLAAVAASEVKAAITAVEIGNLGSTDSESFEGTMIPRITFSSITPATMKLLHGKKDNFESIRQGEFFDSFRLLTRFLEKLDRGEWMN